MNVRDFCREPGYRSALVLTWSFDALFFEKVVLADLRAGGTGTVAVLADRGEVESVIARWPGVAQHLGRRYALDVPGVSGHFHPKMILRTGSKGAYAWVATGNVTPAGWGGNRELGLAWRLGPSEIDQGQWIAPFLEQLQRWAGSPSAREAITRVRDEPWIGTTGNQIPPVLWTSSDTALAPQLEKRWAGRRFKHLRLLTGSTDEGGAFISWAQRVLGIEGATIVVSAESASFDADALEKLPIPVEFIEPPGDRSMHAKCYWFDGPDGAAAVMGSANCSASAWLRPPHHSGNVEMVVAFDSPDPKNWQAVLQVFDGRTIGAREYLRNVQKRPEQPAPPPKRYRLLSAQIDVEGGLVTVEIAPAPPPFARVSLRIGPEELDLSCRDVGSRSLWFGPRPEESPAARALFASAQIIDESGDWPTAPRWIDWPGDLTISGRDRTLPSALDGLGTARDAGEQRRVLEDLQLAMDAVLTDHAAFPDLPGSRAPRESGGPEDTPRRLDPSQMAVALREARVAGCGFAAGDPTASLTGVLRVLFAAEREPVAGPADDPDLGSEEGEGPHQPRTPVTTPSARPSDAQRKRLIAQMDRFLGRLREPSFAASCTATQMVEATAFPVAVGVLGRDSGWVEPAMAQAWVTAALATLLHETTAGSSGEGLLAHVGHRYDLQGRLELFEEIVGNGLLQAVTATALVGFDWSGIGPRLRRALLLRDLFERKELIARATPEKLYALASRFRHGDAIAAITTELPNAKSALSELEGWLNRHFDSLLRSQEVEGAEHSVGDPLWRPGIGWVFVAESAPMRTGAKVWVEPWRPGQFSTGSGRAQVIATGFYVNLRHAYAARRADVPLVP